MMKISHALILAAASGLANAQTWYYTEDASYATLTPPDATISSQTYSYSVSIGYTLEAVYDSTNDDWDFTLTEKLRPYCRVIGRTAFDENSNGSCVGIELDRPGSTSWIYIADTALGY